MGTLARRSLVIALVAWCAACAPPAEVVESNAIWLRVTPSESGIQLSVEGDAVELANLEQALLEHAVAANPSLTPEEAREQVRIYVRGDTGLPTTWASDLIPVLNRFGKVGFVAEDRRP